MVWCSRNDSLDQGACKACFWLGWGIRWQGCQSDGEVIGNRAMTFATAIAGATFALAIRGFICWMANDGARVTALNQL